MTASRIAIDGPAAAGKTAIGRAVAQRLHYLFFDTGAMYRALGLLARRHHVALDDAERLLALLLAHCIELRSASQDDGRAYDVLIDGEDVTWAIRAPDIAAAASLVAVHPPVRRRLAAVQAGYGGAGNIVMVGRDIGTVVMPDADLKLFLTASREERLRRRLAELADHGRADDAERTRLDFAARDERDTTRDDSPLQVADGAIVLVTDGMPIEAVVDQVIAAAQAVG